MGLISKEDAKRDQNDSFVSPMLLLNLPMNIPSKSTTNSSPRSKQNKPIHLFDHLPSNENNLETHVIINNHITEDIWYRCNNFGWYAYRYRTSTLSFKFAESLQSTQSTGKYYYPFL